MAITPFESMKIIKYLKEHSVGDLHYLDLCGIIGRSRRPSYEEFLEYFATMTIKELQKEKVYYNLINKEVICIYSLLEWAYEEKEQINPLIIEKLRTIDTYYTEAQKNNPADDFTEESLLSLIDELSRHYHFDDNEESNLEKAYLEQIQSLNLKISELEKKLQEQETLYQKTTKELTKKTKIYEEEKQNLVSLKKAKEKYDENLKELSKTITLYKSEISRLKNQIKKLETELENDSATIEAQKDTIEKLTTEVSSLNDKLNFSNKTIQELQHELTKLKDIKNRLDNDAVIENKILELICQANMTPKTICAYLNEEGYSLTINEVNKYLKNLKKNIYIIPTSLTPNGQIYTVATPPLKKDRTFNIDLAPNETSYDILVVSDLHLATFGNETIYDLKKINRYCEQNNISLVIDLGDFFNGKNIARSNMYRGICENYKILQRAISKIPEAYGYQHAILGGNHDQDILKYGFDPIEKLTEERSDFLSLGYTNCLLTFNGVKNPLTTIGLHHLQLKLPDFSESVKIGKCINNILNTYYGTRGMTTEDVYLDLLGHIHLNTLDTINGICTVPSLRYDRKFEGALHLKIFFNEQKEIKYIIIINLIKDIDLIPSAETSYQKLNLVNQ